MSRIFVNVKWQLLYRGYQFRLVIIYFFVLNLILAILPVSVCRYLDRTFMFLVMTVNITYALSVFWFFISGVAYVDGQDTLARQELLQLAEPNPWLRLLARLLTNMALSLLCFGNALLGSRLMDKFADINHSYFKLEMNGNIPQGFLSFALILPLLYHLICLYARRGKSRPFSLPALILSFFFLEMLLSLLDRYPGWLTMLITSAVILAAFWKAGSMEKA